MINKSTRLQFLSAVILYVRLVSQTSSRALGRVLSTNKSCSILKRRRWAETSTSMNLCRCMIPNRRRRSLIAMTLVCASLIRKRLSSYAKNAVKPGPKTNQYCFAQSAFQLIQTMTVTSWYQFKISGIKHLLTITRRSNAIWIISKYSRIDHNRTIVSLYPNQTRPKKIFESLQMN